MKRLEYIYYCDRCNGRCANYSDRDSVNKDTGECLCVDCAGVEYLANYVRDLGNANRSQ